MLLVPTFVAPSAIAGLGLFAACDIKSGTVVWRFDAGVDRRVPHHEFLLLPSEERVAIQTWGYLSRKSNTWILCGDDARRVNHSETPNLSGGYGSQDSDDEGFEVAIRDIAKGEELTDNYYDYDASVAVKLG